MELFWPHENVVVSNAYGLAVEVCMLLYWPWFDKDASMNGVNYYSTDCQSHLLNNGRRRWFKLRYAD